jgi:hypothetical protein
MSFIGFGALTGTVTAVLRWPLLFFLIFATLVFLYRHGPYSAPARFAWISVGGVLRPSPGLAPPHCCPGISRMLAITM